MARELLIDTSGFFAILTKRDPHHESAENVLRRARKEKRRLITSDYVLDETATLLKARGEGRLMEQLFQHVFDSLACRVEWMDDQRFAIVRGFFLKHSDQSWSFTDCFSVCLMREFQLRDALTSDRHFEQVGFVALLK